MPKYAAMHGSRLSLPLLHFRIESLLQGDVLERDGWMRDRYHTSAWLYKLSFLFVHLVATTMGQSPCLAAANISFLEQTLISPK
jgi:hypothetical protein